MAHGRDVRTPEWRCGYCGTPGSEGRCNVCGSAMDNQANAIEGAKRPELILTWLAKLDQGWRLVEEQSRELTLRHAEDRREGRDHYRFVNVSDRG